MELDPQAIEGLRVLNDRCIEIGAPPVLIGAVALCIHFPELLRPTLDYDLALSMDWSAYRRLVFALCDMGWKQDARVEHRWRAPSLQIFDLLPAGEPALSAGEITWPRSGQRMSLAGLGRALATAQRIRISPGFDFQVAGKVPLAFLKLHAFMERPQARARDLGDLAAIMRVYERSSERIYADACYEAGLADVELHSAFLLGLDMGQQSSAVEVPLLRMFVALVGENGTHEARFAQEFRLSEETDRWGQAQQFVRAFRQGLDRRSNG